MPVTDDKLNALDDGTFDEVIGVFATTLPTIAALGTPTALDGMRLVRPNELKRTLGISNATLYRWIAEGRWPRPVRISTRVTGWYERDVLELLAQMRPEPTRVTEVASN